MNEKTGPTPSISARTISLMSSSKVHCVTIKSVAIQDSRGLTDCSLPTEDSLSFRRSSVQQLNLSRSLKRKNVNEILPGLLGSTYEVHRIN